MEENNTPEAVQDETANDSQFPTMTFEELPDGLKEACGRVGWDRLMPVQQKALPFLLEDKDVMVQARTGSGKTGAFVLPLLAKLDPSRAECQALVMVPTRELAQQVAQDALALAGDSGINVIAVYGGVGYKQQLDAFRDGAQLVVGTPGRILDHLVRRSLMLDKLKVVIFDEADRMLSVGFYPDMVEVKRYLPGRIDGAYMFSATFPESVMRLAGEFMVNPEFLSLSSDEANVSAITHQFVEVQAMGKERKLLKLIELENPTSAIIFCNTKRDVEFIAAVLSQFGFDAEGLTSDLNQNKREKLMACIKEGKLRFLVATDVAARGIDIPELSHVFMMEPPEDPESYVHRAGRTGRAGASGTAITLVDVIQKMELERIASRFKITFDEIKDPTEEDVAVIIEERLTALLEKKFRKLKPLDRERTARFLPLVKKYAEDEEAMGLMAMLLDEIYQTTLHGKPATPAQPVESGGQTAKPQREGRRGGQRNERRSDRGRRSEQEREGRREGGGKPRGGRRSAPKEAPSGDSKSESATPHSPAPKSSKPAPKSSKPAPKSSKPAPKSSKPAPKSSKPAPKSSKPAPKSSKPAPKSSKPAPKSTPKAGSESAPGPASKPESRPEQMTESRGGADRPDSADGDKPRPRRRRPRRRRRR